MARDAMVEYLQAFVAERDARIAFHNHRTPENMTAWADAMETLMEKADATVNVGEWS